METVVPGEEEDPSRHEAKTEEILSPASQVDELLAGKTHGGTIWR